MNMNNLNLHGMKSYRKNRESNYNMRWGMRKKKRRRLVMWMFENKT